MKQIDVSQSLYVLLMIVAFLIGATAFSQENNFQKQFKKAFCPRIEIPNLKKNHTLKSKLVK